MTSKMAVQTFTKEEASAEIERLKNLEKIMLYHGTGGKWFDSILKIGLIPWNLGIGHNWDPLGIDMYGFYTPRMDCVYFGGYDKAEGYASFWVEDKKCKDGIVVEAVLDTKNLLADEYSRKKTWMDSYVSIGRCAHLGMVPAEKITKVYDLKRKVIFNNR